MPIAGKPMIERVLDMLAAGGADRFIIVSHPGMLDLLRHLGQRQRPDEVQLVYQDQRLGMAHALECATTSVVASEVDDFLLASCDNLYPVEHVARLITRHRRGEMDATLSLMWKSPVRATASAVVTLEDGQITQITEKPRLDEIPSCPEHQMALCAPALYALSTSVLDYVSRVRRSSRGERELPDALSLLIENGGRLGGQLVEHRMTLTGIDDLLAINRHFLRSNAACATVDSGLQENVTLTPPVRIEAGTRVGPGCEIGPEVYLEAGCDLGAGAVVQRAVVLRGGSVEANQVVMEAVIH
jgi:glucose-1-phosphate thymidylyltransferase